MNINEKLISCIHVHVQVHSKHKLYEIQVLLNHIDFITNGYKRLSWTNSNDPRQRVPLTFEIHPRSCTLYNVQEVQCTLVNYCSMANVILLNGYFAVQSVGPKIHLDSQSIRGKPLRGFKPGVSHRSQ